MYIHRVAPRTYVRCGPIVFAALIAAALQSAVPASAQVTTYSSQAAFNALFPNTVDQNFSAATFVTNTATITNPLDKNTNDTTFKPGDIHNGISISALIPNTLIAVESGFSNYTKNTISTNTTASDSIRIDFTGIDIRQVGLQLTSNPNGNTVDVELFSGVTSLGMFQVANVVGAGTFFGALTNVPLTSVVISSDLSNSQSFVGFNEVQFGPQAPEPGSLPLLVPTLVSFAAAAVFPRLRRRRGEDRVQQALIV